jgi:hypothetical protein
MKRSELIKALKEIVRKQILTNRSLFEAEEVTPETEEEKKKKEEEEAKEKEAEKEKTGPDTEVGDIEKVAPPATGTITKVEPETEPSGEEEPADDKSKETNVAIAPTSAVTKPDGVDTSTKVDPAPKSPDNIISTKGDVTTGDTAKMIRTLSKAGYSFKNASEDQIRQILHNTGDVRVKNDDIAKKIGSKFITVIYTKKSNGSPRVLAGQIGSINKSFGGSQDKKYYMGTPVRDDDGVKVTNVDGKPVMKYPGEWGAKYGLNSDKLKSYDLVPILATKGSVTIDTGLKNAAGEPKAEASRWRTVFVPNVKAVIYNKTVYWKK